MNIPNHLRLTRRELLAGAGAAAGESLLAHTLLASSATRPGLIGFWPLDDAEGVAVRESSRQDVSGTCHGTLWACGKGAALEFVPPESYVEFRTPTPEPFQLTEAVTLAVWVRPASLDGSRMIASNGRQGLTSGYSFFFRGQSLGLILNTSRKESYKAEAKCPDLAVGKWCHVAVTYQAEGKAILFANGRSIGEMPAAGPIQYRPGQKHPQVQFCLGRVGAYGDWFFEGLMRNLAVYRRALSADEIAEEFRASASIASLQLETNEERANRLATAEIAGRIFDEKGRPAAALVTLADRAGKRFGPKRLFYGNGSFLATLGVFAVKVPPGVYSITVTRGPEYYPYECQIEARDGAPSAAEIRLKRFIDMPALGWYPGEHHYHYRTHGQQLPNRSPTWSDAVEAARTGALSFMSYKETTRNAPVEEPEFLCREDMFEGRSHGNMGGHVEWIGVKEQPNGKTFGFLEAKRLGAIGVYDASEQNGPARIDDPSAVIVRDMVVAVAMEEAPIWNILKAGSTGEDPTSRWLLGAWYHFLNCGFRLAAGGFTDGDLNLPTLQGGIPGFGRTYARLPRLSWDEVMLAYRKGRVMATNGPLLLATVNGKEPGDMLRLPGKSPVTVQVDAHAQSGVDQVEIVCNGKVVQTARGGQTHFRQAFPVELTGTCWLAVRCAAKPSPHFGCFAHTSPVYVEIGAGPMRPTDEDIAFLLRWIADYRRLLAKPEKLSAWFAPAGCAPEVLDYLAKAEAVYRSLKDRPRRW